jgi:hypothetical protein
MTKILIIDKHINDIDIFIAGLSIDVNYYYSDQIHDIINDDLIDDIYIGLVYHNTRKCNVCSFNFNNFMPINNANKSIDYTQIFDDNFISQDYKLTPHDESIMNLLKHRQIPEMINNNSIDYSNDYLNFPRDFINFIITLRKKHDTCKLYINFITCSVHTNANHQHDIDKLLREHDITIRYSTNDWISKRRLYS